MKKKLINGIWEQCGIVKIHHSIRCYYCKCRPSENHKKDCNRPKVLQLYPEDYIKKDSNGKFEFINQIEEFLRRE